MTTMLEDEFKALLETRNDLDDKYRASRDEIDRLRAALIRIVDSGCLNGDDYIEELHMAKAALSKPEDAK